MIYKDNNKTIAFTHTNFYSLPKPFINLKESYFDFDLIHFCFFAKLLKSVEISGNKYRQS